MLRSRTIILAIIGVAGAGVLWYLDKLNWKEFAGVCWAAGQFIFLRLGVKDAAAKAAQEVEQAIDTRRPVVVPKTESTMPQSESKYSAISYGKRP